MRYADQIPKLAILVTRDPACLYDLVLRQRAGEIAAEIPLVISNHPTLEPVAESTLCDASGGRWSGGGCDCGAGWPTAYSPGAGGCWVAPAVGESLCDDTKGNWSDDETNAAGTFCDCGYAKRIAAAGCVAR